MSPNKKPARSRAATPKAAPPAKKKLSLVAQVRQQGKLITELLQGRADVLERVGALELANSNRLEREKHELEEVLRILHGGSLGVRVEGRPTTAAELAGGAESAINFSASVSGKKSDSCSEPYKFSFDGDVAADLSGMSDLEKAARAATKDLLSTGVGVISIKHVPSSELFKKLPWWRRVWLAICELFVSPKSADR